jgi:hypothetical protein
MKQVSCFAAMGILGFLLSVSSISMVITIAILNASNFSFNVFIGVVAIAIPYLICINKMFDIAIFADKNYKLGDTI